MVFGIRKSSCKKRNTESFGIVKQERAGGRKRRSEVAQDQRYRGQGSRAREIRRQPDLFSFGSCLPLRQAYKAEIRYSYQHLGRRPSRLCSSFEKRREGDGY